MLERMNNGQPISAENVGLLNKNDTQGNIRHDLDSSIGNSKGQNEETVDELIKKLNARGAKVKILTGDDVAATPSQNKSKKQSQMSVISEQNQNKENIPQRESELRGSTFM